MISYSMLVRRSIFAAIVSLVGGLSCYGAPPSTVPATSPSAIDLGAMLRNAAQHKSQLAQIAHITISESVSERPADFSLFGDDSTPTHYSLLKRIATATDDASVSAILVTLGNADLQLAQAQELRDALSQAKKPVFVYADSYTTATYILATGSRNICILPGGEIEIPGVAVETMYFRGLLDKIGVEPSFIQIGEYKGADEAFTRIAPSPELRGELNALVESLYQQVVRDIAAHRKLGPDAVRKLIDLAIISADEAKTASLVDHVVDIDGLRELMAKSLGKEVDLIADYGQVRRDDVDLSSPFGLLQLLARKPKVSNEPAVAVVYVDGMIVSGDGSESLIGSSTASDGAIRKAMRIAMRDPDIKAVVIRIDSPGGSALASEAAWQAIRRVAQTKPVVVSVGHMAASGGYYIACAGDRIFADPSAIVGSIGVVGGKMAIGKLYEKLGITTEIFARGANAGLFSSTEPFSVDQKKMLRAMMQHTYEQFCDRIMTTRKGKILDVDKVARGRIFVAENAVKLGMVDEIGGMHKALDYAADKGHLPANYAVRILPAPKTLADVLSGGTDARTPVRSLQSGSVAAQLALLPRTVRKALSYQIAAALELERRPVLLIPPMLLDAK